MYTNYVRKVTLIFKVAGFVNLTQFVCKDITLQSLSTKLPEAGVFEAQIMGIGVSCAGVWGFERTAFPSIFVNGNLTAEASSMAPAFLFLLADSQFAAGIKLIQDMDGLAEAAEVTTCSCSVKLNFEFKGGILGWIANVIKGAITGPIEKEINKVRMLNFIF